MKTLYKFCKLRMYFFINIFHGNVFREQLLNKVMQSLIQVDACLMSAQLRCISSNKTIFDVCKRIVVQEVGSVELCKQCKVLIFPPVT